MKSVIYKYELPETENEIMVPVDSIIRHVGSQEDKVFVWIEQKFGWSASQKMRLNVYGTGWEFSTEDLEFIGSTVTRMGFVWHVYIKN